MIIRRTCPRSGTNHSDDEQCTSVSFRALSQQIGLDRTGHIGVNRNRPFLAALIEHPKTQRRAMSTSPTRGPNASADRSAADRSVALPLSPVVRRTPCMLLASTTSF